MTSQWVSSDYAPLQGLYVPLREYQAELEERINPHLRSKELDDTYQCGYADGWVSADETRPRRIAILFLLSFLIGMLFAHFMHGATL